MKNILLRNVSHLGRKVNIIIRDGIFECLDAPSTVDGFPSEATPAAGLKFSDEPVTIDADGLAILPALYNTHCHAAMTLLRGYADDMPLDVWLQDYIWPFEDKLTPQDIREGSRMAVKEMVDSGEVFFNDMYFEVEQTIAEVMNSGMRASIGITIMDNHPLAQTEAKKRFVREWKDPTGGRIQLVLAPHAIYTVCEERLRDTIAFARDNGLRTTIHASETCKEVSDCIAAHGLSPIRYLDSIGFLGPDVILAHCIWVDKEEWDILAERGVTVSHCPCSNMKIGSGRFPYEMAIASGARITLGTDGASSNNNLDLRDEMKFAALLAKVSGDPSLLPAQTVLDWATVNGAEAFGINGGRIAEGAVADCILIDLSDDRMVPCHNLISNWVYSADSRCIRNVICDGRIIK